MVAASHPHPQGRLTRIMSAKADLKHSVALFAVATGSLTLIVAAVTAVVAVQSDRPGWFVCTALAGLVGALQLRRGIRLRNKAVAEGAVLFDDSPVQTTRTATAKPSFLKDRDDRNETGGT